MTTFGDIPVGGQFMKQGQLFTKIAPQLISNQFSRSARECNARGPVSWYPGDDGYRWFYPDSPVESVDHDELMRKYSG